MLLCVFVASDSSLDWETIEQYFVWQLISAHNEDIEVAMTVLPKLEYPHNSEALTNFMLQLKQKEYD